ncbi:MAG: hypothetical protein L0220_24255 [Acidobacteria bacterium]|nr:hypothetical protein [Acidobacteriota bacterium]
MQKNLSFTLNRQRTVHILSVCFILTMFFTLLIFAVRGRGSKSVSQNKVSVESGRPVADAILKLEAQYGWVITYEDPRYVHDSEISDVTLQVRKDLDKYKPGEAPKVLVPKSGFLEFTYDVASDTKLPSDPELVVQKLLDAQEARNQGGSFRLERSENILHVIPKAFKNIDGQIAPQESILDTIISLPAGEKTVEQKIENICAAISQSTKTPVRLGQYPTNMFNQHRDHQEVVDKSARDVLVETFKSMNSKANLSWQLFYSPSFKIYVLNIHMVD